LARSMNRTAAPEALAALEQGPQPGLLNTVRDTSIYTPGSFLMETDGAQGRSCLFVLPALEPESAMPQPGFLTNIATRLFALE